MQTTNNKRDKAEVLYNAIDNYLDNKIKIYSKQRSRLNAFVEYTVREILRDGIKGHEGIFNACKDYAEFDKSFNSIPDLELFIQANQAKIIQEYAEASGSPIDGLTVMTAHGHSKGKYKFSLHIVGNKKYASGLEVRAKLKKFNWTFMPDWAVYKKKGKRQLMRIIGTSKAGEQRPLILLRGLAENSFISLPEAEQVEVEAVEPVDRVEVEDPKIAEALELFKDTPDGANHILKEIQGDKQQVVFMQRLTSSHCEFCNRSHDRDNTAVLFIFDSSIMLSCSKKPEGVKMKCLKTTKGNRAERYVSSHPSKADFEEQIKNDINPTIYNEPWVSNIGAIRNDIMNYNGLIAIRANLGCGKTWSNVRDIAEYLRANPTARILVISMRVSLANKYKNEYVGFESYLDSKGKIKKTKIIVQLDSIGRIDWSGFNPDIVVIDECNQAIKHLTSKTFINQRAARRNMAKFRGFIKHANKVVIMDANLNKFSIDYIKKLRGDDKTKVYWNQHMKQQRDVDFYEKKNDVIKEIIEKLKAGKRLGVAMNYSCETILTVSKALENETKKKILTICRETLGKSNVIDALNNPELWGDYDCVIYSPSIQGGISYDKAKVFDKIYGIFCSASCGTEEIFQQLGRIRKPTNETVGIHIALINGGLDLRTADEQMEYLISQREHALEEVVDMCDGLRCVEYDKFEFSRDGYARFYCEVRARQSCDKARYIENFIDLCITAGYGVKFRSKQKAKLDTAIVKEAKREIKQSKAEALAAAKDLTDYEYDKLKDKTKPTEAEAVELQRRYIRSHYNYTGEITAGWAGIYGDTKTMSVYTNRSLYARQGESLKSSLKQLKIKERKADIKNNRSDAGEGGRVEVDKQTAIMRSLGYNFKHAKHSVYVDWLDRLGFDGFEDERQISKEDLKFKLGGLMEDMDINKVGAMLGKRRQRLESIKKTKTSDKNFIKTTTQFINGGLKSEFGVSIRAVKTTDKRANLYTLEDDLKFIFKNSWGSGSGLDYKHERGCYSLSSRPEPEITQEEIEEARKRLGLE